MKRTPLKTIQTTLKKSPLKKQSEKGKEKEKDKKILHKEDLIFYEKVFKERNSKSDLTGNWLGNIEVENIPIYCHHCLPKEKYPEFRHKEWNICLLEPKFHSQIEINPHLLPKEIHDRYYEFLQRVMIKSKLENI